MIIYNGVVPCLCTTGPVWTFHLFTYPRTNPSYEKGIGVLGPVAIHTME